MKAYLTILLLCLVYACTPPLPSVSPWQRQTDYLQQLSATILHQEGPEIHQFWEFPDEAALWEEKLPDFPVLQAYKDSLELAMGTAAFAAGKQKSQATPTLQADSTYLADHSNTEIIAAGYAGLIRPMHALEAHILHYQISRFPLFSQPTEFHGYILRHPGGKVRVYFTASNTLWPPKPKPLMPDIEAAVADESWYLYQHLHNHYEEPEEGYFGILAPSKPDVHFYRSHVESLNLQEGLVTNGFQTAVVPAADLPLLHGDP